MFYMIPDWNEVYLAKNWELYLSIPKKTFIVKVFICLLFSFQCLEKPQLLKILLTSADWGLLPHPPSLNGVLQLHPAKTLGAPGPCPLCILRVSNFRLCTWHLPLWQLYSEFECNETHDEGSIECYGTHDEINWVLLSPWWEINWVLWNPWWEITLLQLLCSETFPLDICM